MWSDRRLFVFWARKHNIGGREGRKQTAIFKRLPRHELLLRLLVDYCLLSIKVFESPREDSVPCNSLKTRVSISLDCTHCSPHSLTLLLSFLISLSVIFLTLSCFLSYARTLHYTSYSLYLFSSYSLFYFLLTLTLPFSSIYSLFSIFLFLLLFNFHLTLLFSSYSLFVLTLFFLTLSIFFLTHPLDSTHCFLLAVQDAWRTTQKTTINLDLKT